MTDKPKRKWIPVTNKLRTYDKYQGHCAYCGKKIEVKEMQVDHLEPLRLGGADDIKNYMPACRRCNHYKRGNSLEGFREMIEKIPEKLQRDNYIFKVGIDYGFFNPSERKVIFYFEKQEESNE